MMRLLKHHFFRAGHQNHLVKYSLYWYQVAFLEEFTLLSLTILWSQLHRRSCQINCLWKKICTRQGRIAGNYNLPWMSSHSLLSPWLNKHNSSQTMLASEKRQTLLALIEFVGRKAAKKNPSESKRQNWQKGSDPGSWVCLHSSKFHVLHIPAGHGLGLVILPCISAKWFRACRGSENIFAFVLSPSLSSPEQGNHDLALRNWRICAL